MVWLLIFIPNSCSLQALGSGCNFRRQQDHPGILWKWQIHPGRRIYFGCRYDFRRATIELQNRSLRGLQKHEHDLRRSGFRKWIRIRIGGYKIYDGIQNAAFSDFSDSGSMSSIGSHTKRWSASKEEDDELDLK